MIGYTAGVEGVGWNAQQERLQVVESHQPVKVLREIAIHAGDECRGRRTRMKCLPSE